MHLSVTASCRGEMPFHKPGLDSTRPHRAQNQALAEVPPAGPCNSSASVERRDRATGSHVQRCLHGEFPVPVGTGEEFLRSVKEERASCHLLTLHPALRFRAGALLPEESRAQIDCKCSILQSLCSLRCLVYLSFCNETISTFSSRLLHSLQVCYKK